MPLRAGQVRLSVADLVVAGDFDFDAAVSVGGAPGIGIVAEAVLRAQLAVDAVEDAVEFAGGVGEKHGAAHGVGDGLEGMLAGGEAATLVFDGANDDGVKKRAGAHRFLARGVEVDAAGGFAGVGDENDDAASILATMLERARSEKDGVVDGGARAVRKPAHRFLQARNVVGEGGELRDVLVDGKNGQAVPGAQHLTDEMLGGLLLEGHFEMGAEAGVDHDGQIQRLRGFRFEFVNLLRHAFFEELKGFFGKVGRRAIFFVEDADEDIDEIDVDANAPALCRGILPDIDWAMRRVREMAFSWPLLFRTRRQTLSCQTMASLDVAYPPSPTRKVLPLGPLK